MYVFVDLLTIVIALVRLVIFFLVSVCGFAPTTVSFGFLRAWHNETTCMSRPVSPVHRQGIVDGLNHLWSRPRNELLRFIVKRNIGPYLKSDLERHQLESQLNTDTAAIRFARLELDEQVLFVDSEDFR